MIVAFKYFELDVSLRAYGREIWPFATLGLGIADRFLCDYTFTLYLIHTLVLSIWEKYYEHDPENIVDVISIILSIGVATFAVRQVTENRRHLFSIGIARLYESTLGRFQLDVPNPQLEKEKEPI